jgi:hypothetical protein
VKEFQKVYIVKIMKAEYARCVQLSILNSDDEFHFDE